MKRIGMGIGLVLGLACGGAQPPAPSRSPETSPCGAGPGALPAEWPSVLIPPGMSVCGQSNAARLAVALPQDAVPADADAALAQLRAQVADHLAAQPGVTLTGRHWKSDAIYRLQDLEFTWEIWFHEVRPEQERSPEVHFVRCGVLIGGGDRTCED